MTDSSYEFKCFEVNDLNETLRCQFVINTPDCKYDGLFTSYLEIAYCMIGDSYRTWILIIYLVILMIMFFAMGVVADEFFCPSLMTISRNLKLSQNIAGVTILAFGNGAPDIFSSFGGIEQSKPELIVGGLFGAGIFVTTVVAGSVMLMNNFRAMERPLLRDIIFYLVSSYLVWFIIWNGSIVLTHAIVFISIYICYIFVVVIGSYIYKYSEKKKNQTITSPTISVIQLEDDNSTNSSSTSRKICKIFRRLLSLKFNSNSTEPEVVLKRFHHKGKFHSPRHSRTYSHARSIAENNLENAIQLTQNSPHRNDDRNTPKSTGKTEQNKFLSQFSVTSLSSLISIEAITKAFSQSKEFLLTICPIDIVKWHDYNLFKKIIEIIKSPAYFIMTLIIPVVDYDCPKNNWCKILNCLHIITSPQAALFCLRIMNKRVSILPLWSIVLIITVPLSILLLFTANSKNPPFYHFIFSLIGFILSVLTINAIANEIIDILQAIGVLYNLSDAILGLTILAWGNSLGDLVTNMSMARRGHSQMSIAACFGGPLLNLMLGLGLPCLLLLVNTSEFLQIEYSRMITLLYVTLVMSLISSLIIFIYNKFNAKKLHGVWLISLYFVYVLFGILIEIEVF